MKLRLKEALRLMSVENLSTGNEASSSGESLNNGDPPVHPAARHKLQKNRSTYSPFNQYTSPSICTTIPLLRIWYELDLHSHRTI